MYTCIYVYVYVHGKKIENTNFVFPQFGLLPLQQCRSREDLFGLPLPTLIEDQQQITCIVKKGHVHMIPDYGKLYYF